MKPFCIEILNFWAWLDYLGRFFSTHFGTLSLLSMFSINQPLFLEKLSLYIQVFIWDWDLNLGPKELVI